jgi:hypothetical protein
VYGPYTYDNNGFANGVFVDATIIVTPNFNINDYQFPDIFAFYNASATIGSAYGEVTQNVKDVPPFRIPAVLAAVFPNRIVAVTEQQIQSPALRLRTAAMLNPVVTEKPLATE